MPGSSLRSEGGVGHRHIHGAVVIIIRCARVSNDADHLWVAGHYPIWSVGLGESLLDPRPLPARGGWIGGAGKLFATQAQRPPVGLETQLLIITAHARCPDFNTFLIKLITR